MLLWLLLCLLPAADASRIAAQDVAYKDRYSHVEVSSTTRPHIYDCRSPNMEVFSCWWRPLDNLTDGDSVSYVLTYSMGDGPRMECPDYVTAGANSCHFNSSNTSIWKVYCLNVTAVTRSRNYTSQEHCLDVADIVQTEAPVNLSYSLAEAGGDEVGHKALLAWTYPVPSDLRYGWITLIYELQYRRVSEPHNWKTKPDLRERSVELLGLPVDDYVVRVRCRSQNYGHWSHWSDTLLLSIPSRPPAGKLVVLILVTGVGVAALLVIAFGVVPQGRRIKDYFLPPIPKPRIIGIDPLLLKKRNLDELNRHFSNFHSYRPPSYTEDVWDHVSAADVFLTSAKDVGVAPAGLTERGSAAAAAALHDATPVHHRLYASPPLYVQSLSPYCTTPPDAFAAPPPSWSSPEIMTLPGTEYSVMRQPGLPDAAATPAVAASPSPQDFYTCVQLMNDTGEVHLVPCLPPAYTREFPPPPRADPEGEEKRKARKNDGGGGEAAVPLLPVAIDNKG